MKEENSHQRAAGSLWISAWVGLGHITHIAVIKGRSQVHEFQVILFLTLGAECLSHSQALGPSHLPSLCVVDIGWGILECSWPHRAHRAVSTC